MSEIFKYIRNGMKKAVVVGTPDFSQNNQYQDMENMRSDFDFSRKIVVGKDARRQTKTTARKQ
ncbi:MAG: hypothetical protein ACQESH_07985 [Campylobacterota bacterium]